jgi:DNA-binding NarL/FixJ family response regulator
LIGGKGSAVLKELKVFLADESEPIRQQLERALSLVDGCKLVGAASGGSDAIELIRSLQPDVVVLDTSTSHREGIRVLREIRKEAPVAQIIIFTADPSVVLQEVCLEAGADFYLHKTQIQDLIDILSVQLGEQTP